MFNKLVEYKTHHRHTMVPRYNNEYKKRKDYEHNYLAAWVNKQRFRHRNGELLESRYTLLNSIGFVWEDCQLITKQEKWMKMYQQLVEYKYKHNSTHVPQNYNDGNNIHLGEWVSKQQRSHKSNKMLEERYGLLDSIDFVWDARTHNSNNNGDDDDDSNEDDNDDDDEDEKKPAAVVSTPSLTRERERGYDINVLVHVHQSREGTRSIVGSSSSTNNTTKRLPHCHSNCAMRPENNLGGLFTKKNDKEDFVNDDVDNINNNDHSPDLTISNKKAQQQDIANSNSDDCNTNITTNDDNDSFYDDWEHGNWCWL